MKVLQVGDVHGDKTPLELAKKYVNEVDMVVFPGDYADSFHSKWNDQKPILMQILDFKRANPDKVKVLLGNHDVAYLIGEIVSGHQLIYAYDVEEYLKRNKKEFAMVFVKDNWIFSHAGVSEEWMVNKGLTSLDDINDHYYWGDYQIFGKNSMEPYGNSTLEGCTWIRPSALLRSGVKGYNQAVGHTEINDEARIILKRGDNFIVSEFDEPADMKLVITDSTPRNVGAIIDTETNEVKILTI